MSHLSTHVLDAVTGTPASGLAVALVRVDDDVSPVAAGTTDDDGRVGDLGPERLAAGTYRLTFDTGTWLASAGRPVFYPEVAVTFVVDEDAVHLHVPLLLSPFAYSTYRGS